MYFTHPSETNQFQLKVERIDTNPIKTSSQYRQINQHHTDHKNTAMFLMAQETLLTLVSTVKHCLNLAYFYKIKKNL